MVGTPHFGRATFLMCAPQFYDVDYVINPWMAGNVHRASRDLAFAQWRALHAEMQKVADVKLVAGVSGCPDMVFTANAGLVLHGVVAVASFFHKQRQEEEKYFRAWFEQQGFILWETSRATPFEGEGDALFDTDGARLWAGHGSRTCRTSHRHVADAWHTQVTSLHLVDPRFYHLDTCFAPLTGGYVMYFPAAFDAASVAAIEAAYPVEKRIVVSERDAVRFCCNAVNVGDVVIVNEISAELAARLKACGFEVRQVQLSEFMKGGGAAKCLVLRLSDLEVTHKKQGMGERV